MKTGRQISGRKIKIKTVENRNAEPHQKESKNPIPQSPKRNATLIERRYSQSNDQRSRRARENLGSGSAPAGADDVDLECARSFRSRRLLLAFAAAELRQLGNGRLRSYREQLQTWRAI